MSNCINCGREYSPEVASQLCPIDRARLSDALDKAQQEQQVPPATRAVFKNGKTVVIRSL